MALPGELMESNGFDRRAISDGPVTQLQWAAGMNFISASTFNSVSSVIFIHVCGDYALYILIILYR